MAYFILLLLMMVTLVVFIIKPNTLIFWFAALYLIIPEYFAINISSGIPMLSLSRWILILLILGLARKSKIKLVSTELKKIGISRTVLIYFIAKIVIDSSFVFESTMALKYLFITILQEYFVLLVMVNYITDEPTWDKFTSIIVKSSFFVFVLGIQEAFTKINVAYWLKTVDREVLAAAYERIGVTRSEFSFGHPIYFATYCGMLLPFIWYQYKKTGKKFYMLNMLLGIVAILTSVSRGILLALVMLAICIFIIESPKEKMKTIFITILAIPPVAILFGVFSNNKFIQTISNSFKSLLNEFGFQYVVGDVYSNAIGGRFEQISGIEYIIQNKRFFRGFGPDAIKNGLVLYKSMSNHWYTNNSIDVGYVQIFAEKGIIGLVAYLQLYITVGIRSFKEKNRYYFSKCYFYALIFYLFALFSTSIQIDLFWVFFTLYITFSLIKRKTDF